MARPRIDRDAVMALVVQGCSHRSVARALGIHPSSVDLIARCYRDDVPRLAPKPQAPRLAQKPVRVMPRFVRVPAEYRAAGLAEDYEDLVRDFGDAEGERRCRRLLSEMHRLDALDARMGSAA